jgi:hypothetical protein
MEREKDDKPGPAVDEKVYCLFNKKKRKDESKSFFSGTLFRKLIYYYYIYICNNSMKSVKWLQSIISIIIPE